MRAFVYKSVHKLRNNTMQSAKNALHPSESAFEFYETSHTSCNRYSKDALRQGCKRVTVLLQQENKIFG